MNAAADLNHEQTPISPKTFWQKINPSPAPRWLKWFVVLLLLTGVTITVARSLFPTRDAGVLVLCIFGVATYALALAACLKVFLMEK